MDEGSNEIMDAKALGLPNHLFEAAVKATVELRDTGRLLVFLTRRGFLKLIGEVEDFQNEFRTRASDDSIDLDLCLNAQNEMRRLTSTILRLQNVDTVLDYTRRSQSDFSSWDDANKEEFNRRQRFKIDLLRKTIITEAMNQRAMRLATSTVACLEELDFEVVSAREDVYRNSSVKDPFLRLRLRYTKATEDQPSPFFIFFIEGMELPAPSFEFECDLSDVDLILKRLNSAKRRLLELQEPKRETE